MKWRLAATAILLALDCVVAPGRAGATPGAGSTQTCTSPSIMTLSINGFPEVHAQATGADLWAQLQYGQPARVGSLLKIVWRMTGSGAFRVTAIGQDGQTIEPRWGPEYHGSSNWNHPGQEWGTGFSLPIAGCWDLRASRGTAIGNVWIVVAPALPTVAPIPIPPRLRIESIALWQHGKRTAIIQSNERTRIVALVFWSDWNSSVPFVRAVLLRHGTTLRRLRLRVGYPSVSGTVSYTQFIAVRAPKLMSVTLRIEAAAGTVTAKRSLRILVRP